MGRVHVRSLAEMTEKNESEKKEGEKNERKQQYQPSKLKILISPEDLKI